MKQKIKMSITIIAIGAMFSCQLSHNHMIECALKSSGDNKEEIEKILNHYSYYDNRKRYAKYLIANMRNHYSYDTALIHKYRPFIQKLSELRNIEKIENINALDSINEDWKRFLETNSIYKDIYSTTIPDLKLIQFEYLIHDINLAIDVLEKSFWKDSINETIFMEEILPYRKVDGYIIENWRDFFYNKYKHFLNPNYSLHQQIDTLLELQNDKTVNGFTFGNFPYVSLKDYQIGKVSHCETRCWFNSLFLSALGIPCAIDYVPAWGNRNGSHMWNALVQKDNTSPFEATGGNGKWKCKDVYNNVYVDEYWFKSRLPKVFRKTYLSNPSNYSEEKLTRLKRSPIKFLDKDVSDEYFTTSNIMIPIKYEKNKTAKYAYLAVFNTDEWIPVFWGDIYNDKVSFQKMGRNIVYLPVFYKNGLLVPFNDPFLLDSNGTIHYFHADTTHMNSIKLDRKYCERPEIGLWRKWNENAVVEIADNPKFIKAKPIYKIPICKSYMNTWKLPTPVNSRYIRYIFPKHKDVLAELSFSSNGKILTGKRIFSDIKLKREANKLFDNNILTFANFNQFAVDSIWIGFDLGENKEITEINLCPRNDDNNVVKGRSYELFYWNKRWTSLGCKKAEHNYITYDNVPSNALMMLRCTSGGKENRIFTWNRNHQNWW